MQGSVVPRWKGDIEAMTLVVGPILAFRGSENGKWCICALVVTTAGDTPPEMTWFVEDEDQDGKDRATPERVRLKSFDDFEVWRFDWSVERQDNEQTIGYTSLNLKDSPSELSVYEPL